MTMKDVLLQNIVVVGGDVVASENSTYSMVPVTSINNLAKIIDVSSQQSVIVDMGSSMIRLKIKDATDAQNEKLSSALETLFKDLNSQSYDRGTVKFDSELTPEVLQPRKFFFTTAGVNETSKIFICILTGASVAGNSDPTVCEIFLLSKDTDPVIPSSFTAALYVSSQIIFESILLPPFQDAYGSDSTAVPIAGIETFPAYELKTAIDIRCVFTMPTCKGNKDCTTDASLPRNVLLNGANDGSIHFYTPGSEQWDIKVFFAYSQTMNNPPWNQCLGVKSPITRWFKMDANSYTFATTSEDGTIVFPSYTGDVNLQHQRTESGWGESNVKEKNKATDTVHNCIQSTLNEMNFKVDPVSVFVLTNLIFPEAKVMKAEKVDLAGDMLVLGNIVKDYNPSL